MGGTTESHVKTDKRKILAAQLDCVLKSFRTSLTLTKSCEYIKKNDGDAMRDYCQ